MEEPHIWIERHIGRNREGLSDSWSFFGFRQYRETHSCWASSHKGRLAGFLSASLTKQFFTPKSDFRVFIGKWNNLEEDDRRVHSVMAF